MYPRALGRSAAALGGVGMVSQILIISEMIRSGKGLNIIILTSYRNLIDEFDV